MTVVLDGGGLDVDAVNRVARDLEEVEVHADALARIEKCRGMLEKKISANQVMYGVNTGIGDLADVVLSAEEVAKHQKMLIYSHAAGVGKPMDEKVIRAAITSRINVHCNGNSGQRPVLTTTLAKMLNAGVHPVVCQRGSVGACGDLAPMAQLALVLMGEGEAFYRGERLPGKTAMKKAGIPTIEFEARDGLAMINGSNFITAMGCLQIWEVERWLKVHDIAAAMTFEALNCNTSPFDTRVHRLRGFPGAISSANNLMKLMEGSDIFKTEKPHVQDAYSIRSTPQVVGSARDAYKYARAQFDIELNGVSDNPIFLPDQDIVLTGANFQGTPVTFPLELMGLALTTVCVLSERRLNRLMTPGLSEGLPPFLTRNPGMMSGLMITQYTVDALVAEQRVLSTPAAHGSIPAAAEQEDFVSMGMTTAIKTRQILEHAYAIIGIELIAGAQALDLRETKPGKGTQAAYEVIRKHVSFLEDDRPVHDDINVMAEVIKSGKLLEAVEKAAGTLES
jgi:histidine ammonia-lyase